MDISGVTEGQTTEEILTAPSRVCQVCRLSHLRREGSEGFGYDKAHR